MRPLRHLALLMAALGLAGCAGYLWPFPLSDGEHLFLLLAGSRLDGGGPETRIFMARGDGPAEWVRLPDRTGAALSAAAWDGRLWLLYPGRCSAYRLAGGDLERTAVHCFRPGWQPQALVVHAGGLWALGLEGERLRALRRTAAGGWEPLAGALEVGSAVTRVKAVGTDGGLWALWRKRGPRGELLPQTFWACRRDGSWHLGTALDLGGGEYAAARHPSGEGILVAASRKVGAGPASGGEIVLCRLRPAGWGREQVLEVPPRELGSATVGLGLLSRPGRRGAGGGSLLLFVGRSSGVAVYGSELGGAGRPGAWEQLSTVKLDLRGPEAMLGLLLLLAAAAVGTGLGMAAVRRTRAFPLEPGQPRPAPLPLRAAAWLLDNVLVGLIFYAVILVMNLSVAAVYRQGWLFLLVVGSSRLLFFFYAAVFEARWGATPGKLAFGLRVAGGDGRRASAKAAAVRNAFRLFDEALLFPLPGLLMMTLSRHAQRLGDVFAGTVVTTARSLRDIFDDRRRKSDRFGLP